MTDRISKILQETNKSLKKQYGDRLAGLTLYGSHARNESVPGSDIDILVILNGTVNPAKEIIATETIIAKISLKYNITISCYFISEKDYLKGKSPLIRNIKREGIQL